MTLVIVSRLKNIISFSSDSRVAFGSQGHIDFGIKVFSVPVKIHSPTDSQTGMSTLDYDYSLGLAVAGSTVNSYIIKESVFEILQHLQHAPGYTDLSMDGISKLIFKVYEKTTLGLTSILQKNALCLLILGGYCPKEKRIRIFKYSTELSTTLTATVSEILTHDGMEFYGSGEKQARLIHSANQALESLHIIREVIKGGQVPTVGGGLQYGQFVSNNFKVYGVEDYKLEEDGSFKEFLYTLRGLNLYKEEFERGHNGFHVAYTFKRPFEKEIQQAAKDFLKGS